MAKSMQGIVAQGGLKEQGPNEPDRVTGPIFQPLNPSPPLSVKAPSPSNPMVPQQPNQPAPAMAPDLTPEQKYAALISQNTALAKKGGGVNWNTPEYETWKQQVPVEQRLYTNRPQGRKNEVYVPDAMPTPAENLTAQIQAMLPGATSEQVQHVAQKFAMKNLERETNPVYRTVPPGQTLMAVSPQGAKPIYQSPADPNADFVKQRALNVSQYQHSHDAYSKDWNKISENIPDEPEEDPQYNYMTKRNKAHWEHNTNFFMSHGVDPETAKVHRSRELFIKEAIKKQGGKVNAQQREKLYEIHKIINKRRNQQMKQKYNNTVNFID
jgi:hypothetical protein